MRLPRLQDHPSVCFIISYTILRYTWYLFLFRPFPYSSRSLSPHTHTCAHTRAHADTHACTRARARTHKHIHTHTHTHNPPPLTTDVKIYSTSPFRSDSDTVHSFWTSSTRSIGTIAVLLIKSASLIPVLGSPPSYLISHGHPLIPEIPGISLPPVPFPSQYPLSPCALQRPVTNVPET